MAALAWSAAALPGDAPVPGSAWGEAVEGLRLGLRASPEQAIGPVAPAWSLVYQNAGQQALVLPAEGRSLARLRVEAQVLRPDPNNSFTMTLEVTGPGNPVTRKERPESVRLAPGESLAVALKPFLKWEAVQSLSGRASFELEAAADVEGWQGAALSGTLAMRRTRTGWALSRTLEDGRDISRDDWAGAEQVWEEFRKRKPEFIAGLQAQEWNDRREAACALGKLGAEARDALPQFAKLLKEEDPYEERPLHQDAVQAIGELGGAAPEAVAVLAAVLADQAEDNRSVRLNAVRALGRMRSVPAHLEALVKALKDPWGAVRLEAALTLGREGAAAKEAVPALQEALKDPLGAVHEAAREAIRKVTGEPKG
jgi:HEAT repeat protein